MKLIQPSAKFVNSNLKEYKIGGGHLLNEKLLKLFRTFNDTSNLSETRIKVAALNTLYSTAIKNIKPVVNQIVEVSRNVTPRTTEEFVELIDQISEVEWTNQNSGKSYKRNNISFASKYVHFLSEKQTPIYDSYIWIIIKGYLGQNGIEKMSFRNPNSYSEFYETFTKFKTGLELQRFSNYELDKFLWQYGRKSVGEINEEQGLGLGKAKTEFKRRIREN